VAVQPTRGQVPCLFPTPFVVKERLETAWAEGVAVQWRRRYPLTLRTTYSPGLDGSIAPGCIDLPSRVSSVIAVWKRKPAHLSAIASRGFHRKVNGVTCSRTCTITGHDRRRVVADAIDLDVFADIQSTQHRPLRDATYFGDIQLAATGSVCFAAETRAIAS